GRDRNVTKTGLPPGQPLKDFADETLPSPDGRSIAYSWFNDARGRHEIRVVGRDGGQARVVYLNDMNAAIVPEAWPAGSTWFLVVGLVREASHAKQVLMLVPSAGGDSREIAALDGSVARGFALSPDGRYVVFNKPVAPGRPEQGLFVVSVQDGVRPLLASQS